LFVGWRGKYRRSRFDVVVVCSSILFQTICHPMRKSIGRMSKQGCRRLDSDYYSYHANSRRSRWDPECIATMALKFQAGETIQPTRIFSSNTIMCQMQPNEPHAHGKIRLGRSIRISRETMGSFGWRSYHGVYQGLQAAK
jgi:hypothetical protein